MIKAGELRSALEAAEIAVLLVGADGRIRWSSPAAAELLPLLPLNNVQALPREVQDAQGHWFAVQVNPYPVSGGEADGVVIQFVDIQALKRAKRAASQRDAMVRGFAETLSRAIVVADSGGRMLMVNSATEQMFGYSREELLGEPMEMVLPHRAHEAHVGLQKDGREFPVEINLSYFHADGARFAVASVWDLTKQGEVEAELAEKEKALRRSEEQLRALTASLLTAHEEERALLAGELHDDLCQRLAAAGLKAGLLEHQVAGSPHCLEAIRDLRRNVEKICEDVRELAHELHPSALTHFGLARALRSYCEEFTKLRAIKIRYRQRAVPAEIPSDIALCLYRVVQEALTNVAKHSGARKASVALIGAAGRISVIVSEDGIGFDPSASHAGIGLISMRERVRLCRGTLSVRTRPGDGCVLDVTLPLKGDA